MPQSRPVVHGPPDMVPYRRFRLPFVDQPWGRTGEQQRGVHGHGLDDTGVGVHEHLARRRLACGRGLSAHTRSLDDDGTGGGEAPGQLVVGDSGPVDCLFLGVHGVQDGFAITEMQCS